MQVRQISVTDGRIAALTVARPVRDPEADRLARLAAQQARTSDHYHAVLCDAWGTERMGRPVQTKAQALDHSRRWIAEYRDRDSYVERTEDGAVLWKEFRQRLMRGNRSMTRFDNIVQTARTTACRCERAAELTSIDTIAS